MTTSTWASMDDFEPPEEESEAMKGIRAWRATERKKMVDSMERLLSQAQKLALSQYTRSAERSKWTRLAGQLLWYKDQILRAMTWDELAQESTTGRQEGTNRAFRSPNRTTKPPGHRLRQPPDYPHPPTRA